MKQVIVVRTDLNMGLGKAGAQIAHASVAVVLQNRDHPHIEAWSDGDLFTKILVGCGSEEELFELERKAEEAGMLNCLIQDSGKTEFQGVPTYTVLAIGPDEESKFDDITGHLKLLRR